MDTIFALATAQGRAGVAVIRISGPQSWDVGTALAGSLPKPRKAGLRRLTASDGTYLDEALVLTFEEKESFTGEKTVELQTHGSIAVVNSILKELGGFSDCRLAEPGEFTRRAMESGRLDLVQVEALSDLIEAETELQRKQALRMFDGAFGERVLSWRQSLIRAASLLEAVIDFADEEVPEDVSAEVSELLKMVIDALNKELTGFQSAERIRSGFEVAIIGAPNVGKSTLLNALAGRDAAITSEIAGTTRDVIEVRMDLSGIPVTLLDTAGLRVTEDTIEALGIARAKDRASAADLRVFLKSGDEAVPDFIEAEDLVFETKADLTGKADAISAKSGEGLDKVIQSITHALQQKVAGAGLATRERHRVSLVMGVKHLEAAERLVSEGSEIYDIAAEEIRTAVRGLESLVGKVGVEDLLDEIFSSFCLGK